jgi:16S rRNA (uracil1498-N3)-methyltransferase
VLIAVGPEGGFTATEDSTLRQAGFQAISLGPGILRFETAAIAAAAQALTARLRGQQ